MEFTTEQLRKAIELIAVIESQGINIWSPFNDNSKFEFNDGELIINKLFTPVTPLKQSTSFKEPTPKYVPIEFEPIEFKDYKDLPFSKRVNDMMFSLHKHIDEDMADKENLVVYTEDDVTVLLQTLMSDLMSFL